MPTLPITNTFNFEQALQNERARLVRLCAYFSHDPGAAEDLAQETLLEAWRHADRLHDPTGYSAWLAAIARNVSLRTLPERAVTFQGQDAIQETFQALDTSEQFQVIYDAQNYTILSAWVEHG